MSDLNEIVPVENPDSRRDLLSQQFDEVAEAAPEPARAEPARVEKPRDESGKYAKQSGQAAADPAEPVEEPLWKRPPASWKKDYHEDWKAAPARVQEYAWQRENEMKAGVEPLISKAQFADQMQEVLSPYMNTIQGLGIDAPGAVKALMEADHALRFSNPQEKRQYFARLAQNYGVNLSDMGDQQQLAPTDSTIYALQNELNNVRGEVQGWKQAQEQQQNQALLGEINNFSQKAEHFEEARPAMIQLLQGGMAANLDEAYEKAIRLNPELFDAVQSGRQAESDATKRAAANTAAKRARAAAVSVKGSTPGTVTNTKAQDRRALLAEQFDNISDRL